MMPLSAAFHFRCRSPLLPFRGHRTLLASATKAATVRGIELRCAVRACSLTCRRCRRRPPVGSPRRADGGNGIRGTPGQSLSARGASLRCAASRRRRRCLRRQRRSAPQGRGGSEVQDEVASRTVAEDSRGAAFRGLWRNPQFMKLWASLTITLVRRADHEPRAAADGRGAAARHALADGRAGRAGDAAVRAREPARGRADRSRAQAADRDRRGHRTRRCRCSRSRSPPTRARCRSNSSTWSGSCAACRTSWAGPPTRCCSRRLAGRDRLVEANAKVALGETSAALVGPGLAGGLIQLVTAPFAIVLDALTFFASAAMLRRDSSAHDVPHPRAKASVTAEIQRGFDARAGTTGRCLRSPCWRGCGRSCTTCRSPC